MSGKDHFDLGLYTFGNDDKDPLKDYFMVRVKAGRQKSQRIVPPAGEDYAFERVDFPVNVEVMISPTGRSVQVHVNGERVK